MRVGGVLAAHRRSAGRAGPALPLAVRELVLRRLARLSTPAQLLVELAAVLGREFSLATAAGHGRRAPRQPAPSRTWAPWPSWWSTRCWRPPKSGQYRFVHDKLREIAYAQTPARAPPRPPRPGGQRHRAEPRPGDRLRPALRRPGRPLRRRPGRPARARLPRAGRQPGPAFGHGPGGPGPVHAGHRARRAGRLPAPGQGVSVAGRGPLRPRRSARLPRRRQRGARGGVRPRAPHPRAVDPPAAGPGDPAGSAPAVPHPPVAAPRPDPGRRRPRGRWPPGCSASVTTSRGDWLSMTASLVLGANLAERAHHAAEVIGAFARLGYVSGLARLGAAGGLLLRGPLAWPRSRGDLPALALTLYLRAFHDLGQGRFAAAEETGTAGGAPARAGGRRSGRRHRPDHRGARDVLPGPARGGGRVVRRPVRVGAPARQPAAHGLGRSPCAARSLLVLGRAGEALPLLEEGRLLAGAAGRPPLHRHVRGAAGHAPTWRAGRLADAEAGRGHLDRRGCAAPCCPSRPACTATWARWRWPSPPGSEAETAIGRRAGRPASPPRRLSRFARMFPMARPAALAMRAAIAAREGDRDRAARLRGWPRPGPARSACRSLPWNALALRDRI